MNRWINRLFAVLTFGPILLWVGAIASVMVLSGVFGCRIDEGGTYPCLVFGVEMGETAALLGILAAWGLLIVGPFVVVSGLTWGLLVLIRRIRLRVRDRSEGDGDGDAD